MCQRPGIESGPLPGQALLRRRTAAALAKSRRPVPLKPADVDEVRIVASWVASHMPEEMPLSDDADVVGFVEAVTGSGSADAEPTTEPKRELAPG